MKLRCKPEGRPMCWTATVADVRAWLDHHFGADARIHCIIPSGRMMFGADWSRAGVNELLDEAREADGSLGWAVVLDPQGSVPGHHLVCATTKLYAFEVGITSEGDLERADEASTALSRACAVTPVGGGSVVPGNCGRCEPCLAVMAWDDGPGESVPAGGWPGA